MNNMISAIEQTCKTESPCGNESEAIKYIKSELEKINVKSVSDGMNNIIIKNSVPEERPRVLLAAHTDEPCFIVTQISENGYLKFDMIGDTDSRSILSKRVVCGNVKGVISARAIHLLSKEEREREVNVNDLFIDIGAENADLAKRFVSPGDCFVFDTDLIKLGNRTVSCFGISDKISYLVLLDIIRYFRNNNAGPDAVFTVQRHMYNRGMKCAITSSFTDLPIGLSVVIDCIDIQKIDKKVNALNDETVYLAVDKIMFGYTSKITDKIKRIAENMNVNLEILTDNGKSDANAFITQNSDVPTVTLMTGCLNKNTAYPIININGVQKLKDLIIRITEDIFNNGID